MCIYTLLVPINLSLLLEILEVSKCRPFQKENKLFFLILYFKISDEFDILVLGYFQLGKNDFRDKNLFNLVGLASSCSSSYAFTPPNPKPHLRMYLLVIINNHKTKERVSCSYFHYEKIIVQ